jgi:ABC-type uncharacterized transport system ATPase subunit
MKVLREENDEKQSSSSEASKSALYDEKQFLDIEQSIADSAKLSPEEKRNRLKFMKKVTKAAEDSVIGRSATLNDIAKIANRQDVIPTGEKVENVIPRSNVTYPHLPSIREDAFPNPTASNKSTEEEFPRPMERVEKSNPEPQQSKSRKIFETVKKNFKK